MFRQFESPIFLTARSSDRAVLFWGLTITAGAGLAVSEANHVSAIVAAAGIPFCPVHLSKFRRFALLAIGIAAYLAGPISLMLAAPGALLLAALPGSSAVALLALASVAFLSHHFQSVPNFAALPLHAGSLGFVIVPSITGLVSFGARLGWRAALAVLGAALVILFVMVAGAGRWITYLTFTSPVFRTMAAMLPVCAALPWLSWRSGRNSETGGEWMLWFALVGAVLTLFIHGAPIRAVVFDESHGRWATVQSPYGPTDFGRVVNYTYSLLAGYGARLVGTVATFDSEEATLPERDALFVLKMPTKPLSEEFSLRLEKWVREGGRLLVVADHTDLYDTAQNLNAFLSGRFRMRINSDSVFDFRGMPTVPTVESLAAIVGRIDALGQPLPWQTGTSLAVLPPNAVQLSTFGMSFSEPGDYSRPNRFGPLASRVSLRFANHTSIAAFGADKGAIAILLDSTPWSNFSIFKEEYKRLFRGIIHSLSNPIALHVWGWSAIALGSITLILALWRLPAVMAAGGLMLGLSAGAAAQIGVTSFYSQVQGRDFGLRVIVGPTSRLEFLKQLVGPGERNFSRIISAMSKYDLDPSASTPGVKVDRLKDASKWLLIQPDVRQLPSSEEVISHLHARGDLTILFAPEQAANSQVRTWLGELALVIQEVTALAISEDARPGQEGLLSRRGAATIRDIRPVTRALPTSLLKDSYADQYVQSYTARPTSFPRSSGLLNISFSADQFSDAAMGDVWEGIQPATIGMLRERQLAAALEGKDLPSPFPERLAWPSWGGIPSTLSGYLLMEDGNTVLTGHFDANSISSSAVVSSPIENPVMYLFDLRGRAASFIASACPRTGKVTHCKVRMLGPDLLEWAVSWASNDDGTLAAVELLHERSFSGLGKTLNVLFGD